MSKEKEIVFEEGSYSSIKFLEHCTNEELAPLVKILTDSSTSKLDDQVKYKEHYPNHQKYINDIIDDYEKFGGNTFANMWRGPNHELNSIIKKKMSSAISWQ